MTAESVDRSYSYVTQRNIRSIKYEWLVKDVSFYGNDLLESSTFSSGLAEIQDEWTIQVQLKNSASGHSYTNIPIWLKLKSLKNGVNFLAQYDLSIIDSINKQRKYSFAKSTKPVNFSKDYKEVQISVDYSSFLSFLSNDTLLISLVMKISTDKALVNPPTVVNTIENVDIVERQLTEDFAELLTSGKSSDVIIKVKTKTFKAIKGVLAVRSPVFRAMFDHDKVKENTNNEVIIEDIDEDVFEELLNFIYTDKVDSINEMPMDLLVAADRYELNRLKNLCEKTLLSSINNEKATQLFLFADKYNAEKLKHGTLMFIKSNLREVLATEDFKKFKKDNSSVLLEILQAVGSGN